MGLDPERQALFQDIVGAIVAVRAVTWRPRLYLAGKVGPYGWRDAVIGGRAGSIQGVCGSGPEDPDHQLFDPEFTLDAGPFTYGGPFFISCDHGCFHGSRTHGVGDAMDEPGSDRVMGRNELHARVFKVNFERVKRCDLLFAYINERDCFGTLVEVGHAQALGKPVIIAFGPNAPSDEMWMAAEGAMILHGDIADTWATFERAIFRHSTNPAF